MKVILTLIITIICSNQICSQIHQNSLTIRNCDDWELAKSNKDTLFRLEIIPRNTSFDSCYASITDLSIFKRLNSVSLIIPYKDSIFESKLISSLSNLSTLEELIIYTKYKHDFNGFESVKSIGISDGLLNNPNILKFDSLETIVMLSIRDSISSDDPLFDIKSIKEFYSSESSKWKFPYEAIGKYKNLEILELDYTFIKIIPEEWNSLKSLKKLTINAMEQVDLSALDLSELTSFNYLQIRSKSIVPEIHESFFQNGNVEIGIFPGEIDKEGLKKMKRYKKFAKKAHKQVSLYKQRVSKDKWKVHLDIDANSKL